MNVTYITAYLNLEDFEKRPPGKSNKEYFDHSLPLLKCGMPFIFFCENSILKDIPDYNNDPLIKIIGFNIEDLKHYNSKFLNAHLPETRNEVKDTNFYMLVILQKIYWMQQVSEENPFNTKYFCWIDFGINHVLKLKQEDYTRLLTNINKVNIRNNIILPSNGMPPNNMQDFAGIFVDKFHECFLGGVIAGSKESLKIFADYQYNIVDNFVNSYNKITWEVSIWMYIFITEPKLIKTYKSSFDIRILENFSLAV